MTTTTDVRTLKQWRQYRLLTIRALAEKAGTSTRNLQDAERGHSKPFPDTIKRISAALEVEPEQVAEFRPLMGLEG